MPEVVDDFVNLPFAQKDRHSAGQVHIIKRLPELYPSTTRTAYR